MKKIFNQFTSNSSQFTQIAFTLAETLIVIGILGIVAALTLPNLNHATGDKEKITRLQKTYADLTEAIDRAEAIYGPYDEWVSSGCTAPECQQKVAGRILEFMKVSKDCGTADDATCFITTPKADQVNYAGVKTSGWTCFGASRYKALLSTGLALSIAPSTSSIRIFVDADGPNKGKNAWGDDLFVFNFNTKDGLVPQGPNETEEGARPCGSDDDGCANWVITHGNMDYKKTSDGKTCNSGNIVLDWTSNFSCQ